VKRLLLLLPPVACAILIALSAATPAADWPAHLGNNRRNAVSAEKLALPLSEVWVHQPRATPQPAWPPPARQDFYHGGRRKEIVCQYPRDMVFKWPLTTVRRMAEHNIAGKQRGIGRLGADFWPVLKSIRGGGNKIAGTIAGRYSEHSSWGQLTIKTAFLAPGKRGAISTVRFEMVRESVQECEARILIDEALLDAGKRARLGEALARRCQAAV
jgi:hypothetical protein